MRTIGITCLALATGMAGGYLTRWLVPNCKPYHIVAVIAFGLYCHFLGALIQITRPKDTNDKELP